MSKSNAAIVGGAVGMLVFSAIVIVLVWFCKTQCKNLSNKNSETGSSDPSALGKIFIGTNNGEFQIATFMAHCIVLVTSTEALSNHSGVE